MDDTTRISAFDWRRKKKEANRTGKENKEANTQELISIDTVVDGGV
jgi:hypothetical protein